ncbi:MAG: hypothetical protein HC840_27660 [Leptolyngbyaceae cyanobacterium RM2_2_4]|nr:hypothetical protein [Leptolyngbyaceae cyanobacterium RM2_2_4]
MDLAVSLGVVFHPLNDKGKPSPSYWQFAGYDRINGFDNFVKFVIENPNIAKEIEVACNSSSDEASQNRNSVVNSDDDVNCDLGDSDDSEVSIDVNEL